MGIYNRNNKILVPVIERSTVEISGRHTLAFTMRQCGRSDESFNQPSRHSHSHAHLRTERHTFQSLLYVVRHNQLIIMHYVWIVSRTGLGRRAIERSLYRFRPVLTRSTPWWFLVAEWLFDFLKANAQRFEENNLKFNLKKNIYTSKIKKIIKVKPSDYIDKCVPFISCRAEKIGTSVVRNYFNVVVYIIGSNFFLRRTTLFRLLLRTQVRSKKSFYKFQPRVTP